MKLGSPNGANHVGRRRVPAYFFGLHDVMFVEDLAQHQA
jgi:hypothetical protein